MDYLYNKDMLEFFFQDNDIRLQNFYSKCIQGYIDFKLKIFFFLFYFKKK